MEKITIAIPELSASGKPYDVTFDYVSQDVTVLYDDGYTYISTGIYNDANIYNPVSTSIQGWMKEATGRWPITRSSPVFPGYDCDI